MSVCPVDLCVAATFRSTWSQ